MAKTNYYPGKKFGRLTLVSRVERKLTRKSRNHTWVCRCDCGSTVNVPTSNLGSGHTQSCGCLQPEATSIANRTHYLSGTTEHATWKQMKSRCYSVTNARYESYGKRGICMCSRWKDSFENFLADMGTKPSPEYTIDRIDNNGNYSCGKCDDCVQHGWPSNCRWATKAEQNLNKRNVTLYEVEGLLAPVSVLARKYGVNASTVRLRLSKGVPIAIALGLPTESSNLKTGV